MSEAKEVGSLESFIIPPAMLEEGTGAEGEEGEEAIALAELGLANVGVPVPPLFAESVEFSNPPTERRSMAELLGPTAEDVREVLHPSKRQKTRRRRGDRMVGSKLSQQLEKKMGEANSAFFEGDYETAVRLCLGIIKEAPNAHEPYNVLGLVYEQRGDMKRAVEAKQPDNWRRLARMARKHHFPIMSAYCLTKLLRQNPNNLEALWERCKVYVELQEYERAAEGFMNLHQKRPNDPQAVQELADATRRLGQIDKAITYIQQFFHRKSPSAESGAAPRRKDDGEMTRLERLVCFLCELLHEKKDWNGVKAAVRQFKEMGGKDRLLPFDLCVPLGIAHLHMNDEAAADACFGRLLGQKASGIVRNSQLFIDIANAYMSVGKPARALDVYNRLGHHQRFDKPKLWILQARCLREINAEANREREIELYERVLTSRAEGGASSSAPEGEKWNQPLTTKDEFDVRNTLAELYRAAGFHQKSLQVVQHLAGRRVSVELSQPLLVTTTQTPHTLSSESEVRLLVNTALAHFEAGEYTRFMQKAAQCVRETIVAAFEAESREPPLASPFVAPAVVPPPPPAVSSISPALPSTEELVALAPRKARRREQARHKRKRQRVGGVADIVASPLFVTLAMKVLRVWMGGEPFTAVERDAKSALELSEKLLFVLEKRHHAQHERAKKKKKTNEGEEEQSVKATQQFTHVRVLFMTAALLCDDFHKAFSAGKKLLLEFPGDWAVCQLVNLVGKEETFYNKTQRITRRACDNHPSSIPVQLLCGHFCLMRRSYRIAIEHYLHVHRALCDAPGNHEAETAVSLFLGAAYLLYSMTKNAVNNHHRVVVACAFLLRYQKLRVAQAGGAAVNEVNFNLARAFHLMGLSSFAVPLYRRILEAPDEDAFKREAAHNLACMCRASGNAAAARELYRRYVVI